MKKTWNLTYYRDGRPVAERTGVSHHDAVAEIYRLTHGEAPALSAVTEPEPLAHPAETGELSLAA